MALKVKAQEKLQKIGKYEGLVTSRRSIFTPTVDLKDELANTAIQKCYCKCRHIMVRSSFGSAPSRWRSTSLNNVSTT